MESCPICMREEPVINLTKHHMIPRHKGGKSIEENYLWLCGDCHSQLHLLYDNRYLRDVLYNEELILKDSQMKKFGKFAAKQSGKIARRASKSR